MQRSTIRNRGGNYPHDHSATATLDKHVHPKAREPRQAVGNIARSLFAKTGDRLLVIADKLGSDSACVVCRERMQPGDLHRQELSVDFHLRWAAWRKDQIAYLLGSAQHCS